MKKVTMQTIADALNISRVSVWKVLNNQPGVSDNLRAAIIATANELGYFTEKQTPTNNSYKNTSMPTVSVVVSRPDSASFWMKIIHKIAEDFTNLGYNLLYTYLPSTYTQGYTLPQNLINGSIDGIIILNVYDQDMLRLISSTNIPKVFLDISPKTKFENLNGDLFLLEGERTIYQITESIINNGCKKIGFIGDIYYSKTNEERYRGYLNALKAHNISHDSTICFTKSLGITDYKNEIKEFLDSVAKMPDAFVCVNDHIAKVVYDYFTKNNYDIPTQLLLSGYDGVLEYFNDSKFLTTAEVDTKQLGCRLANQLVYRVKYPNAPYEITHITPKIRYGISTMPSKNIAK